MAKLIVANFTISLDGYAAGPGQRMDAPFGDGADALHDWMVGTRAFRESHGMEGGEEGPDNDRVLQAAGDFGATIMGRNMFGPQRGPWDDHEWQGWWGDNPPFHNDVFVMTHHPRPTLKLAGGTSFHFVDGTAEEVLARAVAAAGGKDVQLSGGAGVIRQFLRARLVDELRIAVAPMFIGGGERLFDGLGDAMQGYRVVEQVSTKAATHLLITR
ncbi:dihydrofolate reductase family protein [Nonomuraea sp. NPDC050310]|uniref:dihydrofolate reductase family protein n=1 Tax=Nonomuraea sp. NPDC050310 TaxID=3154935 RepID=UPI0033CF3427